MKVLNIMLGKKLGGIEQMFLDYNQALLMQKVNLIPVLHPKAAVREHVKPPYHTLFNFSQYDPFATLKLRKIIDQEEPDIIITHGNRATVLARKSTKVRPIVAVCHNYKFAPLIGVNCIFSITNDIKNCLVKAGQQETDIKLIPNFIHIPENSKFIEPAFKNKILTIGAIGRFVKDKGFDTLIDSLAILKSKGVEFKLYLGGDGEEKENLVKQINNLNLNNNVKLIGWVVGEQKEKFFQEIDIFVVPSRHEPFGLVVLEGMLNSKPMVVARSEGPSEIVDSKTAYMCDINSPFQMAESLAAIIIDKVKARKITLNAYEKVQQYSILNGSMRLKKALEEVLFNDRIQSHEYK